MQLSTRDSDKVFEYVAEIQHDFTIIRHKFIDESKKEVINVERFNRRLLVLMDNIKKILEITNPEIRRSLENSKSIISSHSISNFADFEAQFGGTYSEIYEILFSEIKKRERRLCAYQDKKKSQIIEVIEKQSSKVQEEIKRKFEEEMEEFRDVNEEIEEDLDKAVEVAGAIDAQVKGMKANAVKRADKNKVIVQEVSEAVGGVDGESKAVNEMVGKVGEGIGMIEEKLKEDNFLKNLVSPRRTARASRKSYVPPCLRSKISISRYPMPEKLNESCDSMLAFASQTDFILVKKNSGFCIFNNLFPKFSKELNDCKPKLTLNYHKVVSLASATPQTITFYWTQAKKSIESTG